MHVGILIRDGFQTNYTVCFREMLKKLLMLHLPHCLIISFQSTGDRQLLFICTDIVVHLGSFTNWHTTDFTSLLMLMMMMMTVCVCASWSVCISVCLSVFVCMYVCLCLSSLAAGSTPHTEIYSSWTVCWSQLFSEVQLILLIHCWYQLLWLIVRVPLTGRDFGLKLLVVTVNVNLKFL